MIPRIVGVDLGLSATGLVPDDVRPATVRPTANGYDRHREIIRRIFQTVEDAGGVDVVILEALAPSLGAGRVTSLLASAELAGAFKVECARLAVPVVTVAPTTLKKFATGNGRASKGEVFDAVHRLPFGSRVANYDEADAFVLRFMGRVAYGLDVATNEQIAAARPIRAP